MKALVLLSRSVFITFNLWKRQTKNTIGFELRKAYWFYPLILCTVAQWFYCMQICGRLLMNIFRKRAENIPCREKTLCHMWYEQSETKNACIVASSGMSGVLLLLGNISPSENSMGKRIAQWLVNCVVSSYLNDSKICQLSRALKIVKI